MVVNGGGDGGATTRMIRRVTIAGRVSGFTLGSSLGMKRGTIVAGRAAVIVDQVLGWPGRGLASGRGESD